MQKIIFMLLLLGLQEPLHAQIELEHVREIFHDTKGQAQLDSILNYKWNQSNDQNGNILAYQAVCKSMKAEYVFSPFAKLSYFQEGTKQLDEMIKMNPCVEKVYLRMLIQMKAPWFLGYHDDLIADVQFLNDNISNSTLPIAVKTLFVDKLLEANSGKVDLSSLEEKRKEWIRKITSLN